jgi:hypothetical protein
MKTELHADRAGEVARERTVVLYLEQRTWI